MGRSSLLGCKKGQWVPLTFVIVILLVLGILYVFLQSVTEDLNTDLQADPDFGVEAKASMASTSAAQGSVFDSGVAIVLVGAWLLCLGLGYNSQGSPLLLVVALFIIVALGFVGMILSNAWGEFSESEGLSGVVDSYPITNFVLSHYLVFVVVIGFTTLLISMSRGGGF